MNNQLAVTGITKMTSREIAELTGKRHDNVMRDIEKMKSDLEHSSNLRNQLISSTYRDGSGIDRRQYELDKEMTMTLVTGYSVKLRNAVIKRWMVLEEAAESYIDRLPSHLKAETTLLECAANLMNISNAGRLQGLKYIAQKHGMDTGILPAYSDDDDLVAHSVSQLLTERKVGMGAAQFNNRLADYGYLRKESRQSSKGGVKYYWSVTQKGLEFGKNLASSQTGGRQTQPYWYDHKFDELLAAVDVK